MTGTFHDRTISNDIAVIKLKDEITFSPSVQPISLPSCGEESFIGMKALINIPIFNTNYLSMQTLSSFTDLHYLFIQATRTIFNTQLQVPSVLSISFQVRKIQFNSIQFNSILYFISYRFHFILIFK